MSVFSGAFETRPVAASLASPRALTVRDGEESALGDNVSQWQRSFGRGELTPDSAVRGIFDGALAQVQTVVANQLQEAQKHQRDAAQKADQVEQLKQIIAQLEHTVGQLRVEVESAHSEAAETAVNLQCMKKETAAQISKLEIELDDVRASNEAQIRDIVAEQSAALAAERANNELDFQELRRSLDEDLEAHRAAAAEQQTIAAAEHAARTEELNATASAKLNQTVHEMTSRHEAEVEDLRVALHETEEAAAAQVAEIEAVWGKKYADAKAKLEKAVGEMRAMRQRSQEMRRMELEALDSSGKTLAQQMEEAMRLIRKAQDHSLTERLRYGSAFLDDGECPSILVDKENSEIPSPSQIRAAYANTRKASTGRLSMPRSSSIPRLSER